MDYTLRPIGVLRTDERGFFIELEPALAPALGGVEGFSHLVVSWWAHHFDAPEYREILEVDKPYRLAPARLGLFATRAPLRPNPLGLSVVTLEGVERNVVRIGWIDAESGTPIVDLKPYHPCADRVAGVRLPEWCQHWPASWEASADFPWGDEFLFGG